MFDLITDTQERPLRERSLASTIAAVVAHVVVMLVLVMIPLLLVTHELPDVPTIMAFVAPSEAPPPPPAPPPPAPAAAAVRAQSPPVEATGQFAAPVEAPGDVQPERGPSREIDSSAGVLGGVEGGVPAGVVGGIVEGIVSAVPPPPPPPPPPFQIASGPVRIGGQVKAPALLHRVEPIYPDFAAVARVTGLVILEATVNRDGCVESVTVLRSRHLLLDKAAQEALRQWRYSPLVLNGIPTPFVLTVTFNFSTT
jgi:periplasmic protein TonB